MKNQEDEEIELKNVRDVMLIADDVELNRALLSQMFENEYMIVEAKDGKEAMDYIEQYCDRMVMVLLDIKMPIMDGFDVLERMKSLGYKDDIPVIFITSDYDGNALERGYEIGVTDVIFKPFRANIVIRRIHNVIEFYEHKNNLEVLVARQTRELKSQYMRLRKHHEHLVDTIYDVIEYRNTESAGHVAYIQGYTRILANCYARLYPKSKMTQDKIEKIVKAAKLHDVGKVAMPDALLSRPGKLSRAELNMLKDHTIKGAQIVQAMNEFEDEEYGRICYNICMYHHEKFGGDSYLGYLRKDRIPIEAQLVGLADIYDALVHMKSDREYYTKEQAYNMIKDGECGQLSSRMLECFEASKFDLENYSIG